MDNKSVFKYILLVVVLIVTLWVGWSDYDFNKPEITQEEIRSSIREYIRTGIQILVQYVIPISIVGYLVKSFLKK